LIVLKSLISPIKGEVKKKHVSFGWRSTRKVSGKYAVAFNGQHVEGQFVVKYREHIPPVICG
jgi:hypothetical protein